MCLTTTKYQSDRFKKKYKDNETIRVWKIYIRVKDDTTKSGYKLQGQFLHKAYFRGISGSYVRKSGTVVSNRQYKKLSRYFPINDHYHTYSGWWDVCKGIHVYTTRKDAEQVFERDDLDSNDHVIVCCHANINDLVAASSFGRAIFMKVSISSGNFSKAIKKFRKTNVTPNR